MLKLASGYDDFYDVREGLAIKTWHVKCSLFGWMRWGPRCYSRRHAILAWITSILRCQRWGKWNKGKPDWRYRLGNWLSRKACGPTLKDYVQ
jgi:hypothetical protein